MISGVVVRSGDEEAVTHTQSHQHAHSSVPMMMGDSIFELLRYRVISQVLEVGIIVHSVIIGIALGASGNLKTIRTLFVALTFHQFFEGMGLGGSIAQILDFRMLIVLEKTHPLMHSSALVEESSLYREYFGMRWEWKD
ncbi:hypothetical protein KY289_030916 [Solanum tuberosum]|nr:hypothetical protein KY289_030916 [Solanum tuberosum]